jgi:hypothetical protein
MREEGNLIRSLFSIGNSTENLKIVKRGKKSQMGIVRKRRIDEG